MGKHLLVCKTMRAVFERKENIAGSGENAGYHFLFPEFSKFPKLDLPPGLVKD